MNEDLISYYANLLILQYRTKEKAIAHVRNVTGAIMIYDIIRSVENGYNINTAEGVQLDVLAKYVNAQRVVTGIDFTRDYWAIVDYSESEPYDAIGLVDYDQDPLPDAIMLSYEADQSSAFSLTDEELRDIIKLKIIQNNSNHSVKQIDDLLYMFYGDQVIFNDNLNMTCEYIFDAELERLVLIAVSENTLPKPMGVSLSVTFVDDINNIFGMLDYNNSIIPDFVQGMVDYDNDSYGCWLTY